MRGITRVGKSQEVENPVSTASNQQVLCADGARLQVQTSGPREASVLVLLQGQANSHDWWAGLRCRYEKRFRTVTMDYRGTGTTQSPEKDLTTGLLAEDVVCVLDALNVDQAHVYGTSMGGRVAQVLAGRHPTRVRSLALACTSPGGKHAIERNNDVRRALADADPSARRAAMVKLFYTPSWGADATQSHLFGDPTMTAADRRRHLNMSADHDAWDLLPKIQCPTVVLHGKHDQITPSANAEVISDAIPTAQLHIHPTGRHGFFDEFAADMDATLEPFWLRAE